jgi:hypothetical protein
LRLRRALSVGSVAVISALLLMAACDEGRRGGGVAPRPPATTSSGTGGGGGQGGSGPCVQDGACADEVHELSFNVPNIYFVFDRSGSMQELEPPDYDSRYTVVRNAAMDLIRSLGPLINVGAALFPHGDIDNFPCNAGQEVMPVSPGDPFDDDGFEGPTLGTFRLRTNVVPVGGTPVSATFQNLLPTLSGLSGRTIVLLATDGGPNCNANAICGIAECMPNIDGLCIAPENCCVPNHPQGGPELCVDRAAAVGSIQAVADAGVEVYVIGIPGSELYAGVLDEMAVAGGVPQTSGPTQYHRVDAVDQLSTLFRQIAADAISCEIELADPPEERDFTNVYFDCDTVNYDPASGWSWLDDTNSTVVLRGAACSRLKSGEVTQVKVATGCPTELPR